MIILIEGMHSEACIAKVRRALANVERLRVREVSPGSAVVEGDSQLQAEALAAIERAGFQPHIPA